MSISNLRTRHRCRSFGSSPRTVGTLGSAVVKGFLDASVFPTLKHFPGHGRTTMDSHVSLPTIKATASSLQQVELKPFQMGIDNGAPLVMSGHLVVPAFEKKSGWPATFSKQILKHILRKNMSFNGVVVTDSLSMEGARKAAKSNGEGVVFCAHDGRKRSVDGQYQLTLWPRSMERVNKFLATGK